MCRKVGPRLVWVTSNLLVCIAMAATALISYWSLKDFHGYVQDAIAANKDIRDVALVLFAFLGVPLAVSVDTFVTSMTALRCTLLSCMKMMNHLLAAFLAQRCRSYTVSRSP
jgi:solute carrier family 45, member 1/2/4